MIIDAIRRLIEDWRMYRRQREDDHNSMLALEQAFQCELQKCEFGLNTDESHDR